VRDTGPGRYFSVQPVSIIAVFRERKLVLSPYKFEKGAQWLEYKSHIDGPALLEHCHDPGWHY
jgi:hypothetical protein